MPTGIPNRKKEADEVKSNLDVPEQQPEGAELAAQNLAQENSQLRDMLALVNDRLARVEAIQSTAKLRKYDELNDPASLRKTGHVLSQDGQDPILFLKKTGSVTQRGDEPYQDTQTLSGETQSGRKVSFPVEEMMSRCAGFSIPCVINDYEAYRERENVIMEKKHQFQRANGKSAKLDTVALRNEIKQLEEDLRMNVTLSLDLGKTFTGATVDIHPLSVLNACA